MIFWAANVYYQHHSPLPLPRHPSPALNSPPQRHEPHAPPLQVWECTDAPQYHHHKPNYNPCCLQKPNRLRVKRAVVLSGLPEVIFDIELVFQMRKFDLVTYVHLSAAVINKWIFCVLINLWISATKSTNDSGSVQCRICVTKRQSANIALGREDLIL